MSRPPSLNDLGMNGPPDLPEWLDDAAKSRISWSELAERILRFEQQDLQAAHRPDLDRRRRCGFAEVIFGAGKSADDVVQIARRLLRDDMATAPLSANDSASVEQAVAPEVLVTRLDVSQLARIASQFPYARYDSLARTLRLSHREIHEVRGAPLPSPTPPTSVAVVTAGSTDLPVAREAIETLRWMQINPTVITDVGVAGPYRLLAHLDRLRLAKVIVVVAGMEGALASVVGGLVASPVIAVPTSVGYGANLAGITTMLSMLSSCAAGVVAVNIDGGFKGGYVAGLIACAAKNA